jgi:hypothetical protein
VLLLDWLLVDEAMVEVEIAGLEVVGLEVEDWLEVEDAREETWDVLAFKTVVVGSREVERMEVLAARELLWLVNWVIADEETSDESWEVLASSVLAAELEIISIAVEDATMDVELLVAEKLLWIADCATVDEENCDEISELLAAWVIVAVLELISIAVEDSATDVKGIVADELLWIVGCAISDEDICEETSELLDSWIIICVLELISTAVEDSATSAEVLAARVLVKNRDETSKVLDSSVAVAVLELISKAVEDSATDVEGLAADDWIVGCAIPDEETCDGISELLACELVVKLEIASREVDENCAIDVGLMAVTELLWIVAWAIPDEETSDGVSETLAWAEPVIKLEVAAKAVDETSAVGIEELAAKELCSVGWATLDDKTCDRISDLLTSPELVGELASRTVEDGSATGNDWDVVVVGDPKKLEEIEAIRLADCEDGTCGVSTDVAAPKLGLTPAGADDDAVGWEVLISVWEWEKNSEVILVACEVLISVWEKNPEVPPLDCEDMGSVPNEVPLSELGLAPIAVDAVAPIDAIVDEIISDGSENPGEVTACDCEDPGGFVSSVDCEKTDEVICWNCEGPEEVCFMMGCDRIDELIPWNCEVPEDVGCNMGSDDIAATEPELPDVGVALDIGAPMDCTDELAPGDCNKPDELAPWDCKVVEYDGSIMGCDRLEGAKPWNCEALETVASGVVSVNVDTPEPDLTSAESDAVNVDMPETELPSADNDELAAIDWEPAGVGCRNCVKVIPAELTATERTPLAACELVPIDWTPVGVGCEDSVELDPDKLAPAELTTLATCEVVGVGEAGSIELNPAELITTEFTSLAAWEFVGVDWDAVGVGCIGSAELGISELIPAEFTSLAVCELPAIDWEDVAALICKEIEGCAEGIATSVAEELTKTEAGVSTVLDCPALVGELIPAGWVIVDEPVSNDGDEGVKENIPGDCATDDDSTDICDRLPDTLAPLELSCPGVEEGTIMGWEVNEEPMLIGDEGVPKADTTIGCFSEELCEISSSFPDSVASCELAAAELIAPGTDELIAIGCEAVDRSVSRDCATDNVTPKGCEIIDDRIDIDDTISDVVGMGCEMIDVPDFPGAPDETADSEVASEFCEIVEDSIATDKEVPDAVGIGCEIVKVPDSTGVAEETDIGKTVPDSVAICDIIEVPDEIDIVKRECDRDSEAVAIGWDTEDEIGPIDIPVEAMGADWDWEREMADEGSSTWAPEELNVGTRDWEMVDMICSTVLAVNPTERDCRIVDEPDSTAPVGEPDGNVCEIVDEPGSSVLPGKLMVAGLAVSETDDGAPVSPDENDRSTWTDADELMNVIWDDARTIVCPEEIDASIWAVSDALINVVCGNPEGVFSPDEIDPTTWTVADELINFAWADAEMVASLAADDTVSKVEEALEAPSCDTTEEVVASPTVPDELIDIICGDCEGVVCFEADETISKDEEATDGPSCETPEELTAPTVPNELLETVCCPEGVVSLTVNETIPEAETPEVVASTTVPDELRPLGCRIFDELIPVGCDSDELTTSCVADSVAIAVIDWEIPVLTGDCCEGADKVPIFVWDGAMLPEETIEIDSKIADGVVETSWVVPEEAAEFIDKRFDADAVSLGFCDMVTEDITEAIETDEDAAWIGESDEVTKDWEAPTEDIDKICEADEVWTECGDELMDASPEVDTENAAEDAVSIRGSVEAIMDWEGPDDSIEIGEEDTLSIEGSDDAGKLWEGSEDRIDEDMVSPAVAKTCEATDKLVGIDCRITDEVPSVDSDTPEVTIDADCKVCKEVASVGSDIVEEMIDRGCEVASKLTAPEEPIEADCGVDNKLELKAGAIVLESEAVGLDADPNGWLLEAGMIVLELKAGKLEADTKGWLLEAEMSVPKLEAAEPGTELNSWLLEACGWVKEPTEIWEVRVELTPKGWVLDKGLNTNEVDAAALDPEPTAWLLDACRGNEDDSIENWEVAVEVTPGDWVLGAWFGAVNTPEADAEAPCWLLEACWTTDVDSTCWVLDAWLTIVEMLEPEAGELWLAEACWNNEEPDKDCESGSELEAAKADVDWPGWVIETEIGTVGIPEADADETWLLEAPGGIVGIPEAEAEETWILEVGSGIVELTLSVLNNEGALCWILVPWDGVSDLAAVELIAAPDTDTLSTEFVTSEAMAEFADTANCELETEEAISELAADVPNIEADAANCELETEEAISELAVVVPNIEGEADVANGETELSKDIPELAAGVPSMDWDTDGAKCELKPWDGNLELNIAGVDMGAEAIVEGPFWLLEAWGVVKELETEPKNPGEIE